jgi:glycosyltransferase involved in cell wall biosynthesis
MSDSDIFCLDEDYSTTRLVTYQKPVIENSPKDKFKSVLFLPQSEGRQGEGGLRTQGYFKKGTSDKPLITVITVVFNGAEFLEETIQSVINQSYDNVEYIIIDGGSTDGTLDIIKKYEGQIDYWVSEKDKGISDAFNKGIISSNGGWILCLNSDDKLFNSIILAKIVSFFDTKSDIFFIYGDYQILRRKDGGFLYNGSVDFNQEKILYGQVLPHPALITNRKYFIKYGIFDISYKIAMDYEWMLRGISKSNVMHIDVLIAKIRDGGVSTIDQNRAIKEIILAIRKNNLFDNIFHEKYLIGYFYSRFFLKKIFLYLGAYSFYKKKL